MGEKRALLGEAGGDCPMGSLDALGGPASVRIRGGDRPGVAGKAVAFCPSSSASDWTRAVGFAWSEWFRLDTGCVLTVVAFYREG